MAESPKTILRLIKTELLDSPAQTDAARSSKINSQPVQKSTGSDTPPQKRQRPLVQFLNSYCDSIDAEIDRIMKL
jgi:hypothetical protein